VVDIARNLERLYQEIHSIACGCGRTPDEVRLLAVSKTFPAEKVKEAWAAGQRLFGENRVQEAGQKIPLLTQPGLQWHLIGPLQSNKARRAVELFDVIQTLDKPKIARKVNDCALERGKIMSVFIQINIGQEEQKHGILPAQVPEMVELVDSMAGLRLQGLMAIPPYHQRVEHSRPYFQRMHELLAQLNGSRDKPLKELSMGMSHDYPVAIQEGATLLRIGTAIFGARSP
jgi:PLP dependent protein